MPLEEITSTTCQSWSRQSLKFRQPTYPLEKIYAVNVKRESATSSLKSLNFVPVLRTVDVDLGFHSLVYLQPTCLPSTIQTITLRNSEPDQVSAILENLRAVTDLTLRLALEWFLPEGTKLLASNQLQRFELSITAWGETDMRSLDPLLSNSSSTLRSLALRNKSGFLTRYFLPVARALINKYSSALTSLKFKTSQQVSIIEQ